MTVPHFPCRLCGKPAGTGFIEINRHPGTHLFEVSPCPACDETRRATQGETK